MKNYPFYLVNVFAQTHFGGNPLAVFDCTTDDTNGLTDTQMQAIAKQFNLSETVFIFQEKGAYHLRIFTPNYELPFAGHPTLGSAYILYKYHKLSDNFTLNTTAKTVALHAKDSHMTLQLSGHSVRDYQMAKSEISRIFGVQSNDIVDTVYFVSTGNPMILLQLSSSSAAYQARPTLDALRLIYQHHPDYHRSPNASVYLWADDPSTEQVYSKMLFEQDGQLLQDSGTGSACANLGAYFIEQIGTPNHRTICQGDDMGRPNRLSLSVQTDGTILVGGNVFEVGRGEFFV